MGSKSICVEFQDTSWNYKVPVSHAFNFSVYLVLLGLNLRVIVSGKEPSSVYESSLLGSFLVPIPIKVCFFCLLWKLWKLERTQVGNAVGGVSNPGFSA